MRLTISPRVIRLLFFGHLAALLFGLGGLLIALPNPQLWAGSRWGAKVFNFGMDYGGSLHIILGALTMLAFGIRWIGARRTLTFFVVTVVLALTSELVGTGTGWPFGNYEYTSFLGYKVLGRVPFTIPLSWFYVGFAGYLLANVLFAKRTGWQRTWLPVLGGAYLLTVWDLVLDPAMAHEDLAVKFWLWSETGAYFGMPLKNFAGWALTGLLFIAISRLLWRRNIPANAYPALLPFGIYLANTIFAIALSLSVDLWGPVILAVVLGIIPAALALRARPPLRDPDLDPDRDSGPGSGGRRRDERRAPQGGRLTPSPVRVVSRAVIARGASVVAKRDLELAVEGRQHLPASGPLLLVARHYHHLHDGAALLATIEHPLHILVALDWVRGGAGRRTMEWACNAAGWPIVLREDNLASGASAGSAFDAGEARRYLRRGVRDSVALLRAGEALVVFPEAYPNVDPHHTPKAGDEFLPFRPGFVRIVELAQRDGVTQVPIVPVGLAYEALAGKRSRVTLRFGAPLLLDAGSERGALATLAARVEDAVHALSAAPAPLVAGIPGGATADPTNAQSPSQSRKAMSS